MQKITKYNFSESEVNSMFVDTTFPYYLWIGFKKYGETNTHILMEINKEEQ